MVEERAVEAVLGFTREYRQALSARMDAGGRDLFPYHSDPIALTALAAASDGVVTFYLPAVPECPSAESEYVWGVADHTVNEVCQSLHLNRLKVATLPYGEPIPSPPNAAHALLASVPDTPPIKHLSGTWFEQSVLDAARRGALSSLYGMTVTPTQDVDEAGIVGGVVPGRLAVWSPVLEFAGLGLRRLYHWVLAEFWWHPETLDLSQGRATEAARADAVALGLVCDRVLGLPPDAAKSVRPTASDMLDRQCAEFMALLAAHGDDEEALHRWFLEHPLFLDLDQVEVRSKVAFGDRVSDFCVRRYNGTWLLVEIETANKRIFTASGGDRSRDLTHALQQVGDWQRYIKENLSTVRNELGLGDIREPAGCVIMGRAAHLDTANACRRWPGLNEEQKTMVLTYDDVCRRVAALADSLRTLRI